MAFTDRSQKCRIAWPMANAIIMLLSLHQGSNLLGQDIQDLGRISLPADPFAETKVQLGKPKKATLASSSAARGLTSTPIDSLQPRSKTNANEGTQSSLVAQKRADNFIQSANLTADDELVFEQFEELKPVPGLDQPRRTSKPNGSSDVVKEEVLADLSNTLVPINAKLEEYTTGALRKHRERTFLPGLVRQSVDQRQTLDMALYSSFRARVLAMQAVEASTLAQQERGAFDWTANLQQVFRDQNNPTGSSNQSLPNPNPSQQPLNQGLGSLDGQSANTQFGVKRKNRLGGEIDVSQSLGRNESLLQNSAPLDQFTSQTSVRYEQQLLRGSGLKANNAKIQIAIFNSNNQRGKSTAEIATRAVEANAALLKIYQLRSQLVVLNDAIQLATLLQRTLTERKEIDASPFIRFRSNGTVANLQAQYASTLADLLKTQIELVRLTNNPNWLNADSFEFVPEVEPVVNIEVPNALSQVQIAFQSRPEVIAAIAAVDSAAAGISLSRNELLPALSTFIEVQASGQSPSQNASQALSQNATGDFVSTQGGLIFELPIPNNRAKGAARENMARYRRSVLELEEQLANVKAEVLSAVVVLENLKPQIDALTLQIEASMNSLIALEVERTTQADESSTPTLRLVNLLDNIDQFTSARNQYIALITEYNQQLVQLAQANGTLVHVRYLDDASAPYQPEVNAAAYARTTPNPPSMLGTIHQSIAKRLDNEPAQQIHPSTQAVHLEHQPLPSVPPGSTSPGGYPGDTFYPATMPANE